MSGVGEPSASSVDSAPPHRSEVPHARGMARLSDDSAHTFASTAASRAWPTTRQPRSPERRQSPTRQLLDRALAIAQPCQRHSRRWYDAIHRASHLHTRSHQRRGRGPPPLRRWRASTRPLHRSPDTRAPGAHAPVEPIERRRHAGGTSRRVPLWHYGHWRPHARPGDGRPPAGPYSRARGRGCCQPGVRRRQASRQGVGAEAPRGAPPPRGTSRPRVG